MKVTVEVIPVKLQMKAGKNELIGRRIVALLQKQAANNISASGGSLGLKKDGTKVTLKESGDLFTKVDFREEKGECSVEFRKEYAQYIFKEFGGRYDASSLSPAYQKQLEAECATSIEDGVELIVME